MGDESLERIRDGVEQISKALAVHDGRVEANVGLIASSQERLASAVEKIGDATVAIRTLAERIEAKNGNGQSAIAVDRRTLKWLIAIALLGAVALGGGQEIVVRILGALAPK